MCMLVLFNHHGRSWKRNIWDMYISRAHICIFFSKPFCALSNSFCLELLNDTILSSLKIIRVPATKGKQTKMKQLNMECIKFLDLFQRHGFCNLKLHTQSVCVCRSTHVRVYIYLLCINTNVCNSDLYLVQAHEKCWKTHILIFIGSWYLTVKFYHSYGNMIQFLSIWGYCIIWGLFSVEQHLPVFGCRYLLQQML